MTHFTSHRGQTIWSFNVNPLERPLYGLNLVEKPSGFLGPMNMPVWPFVVQMLAQDWANVADVRPVLSQHFAIFWCLWHHADFAAHPALNLSGWLQPPRLTVRCLFRQSADFIDSFAPSAAITLQCGSTCGVSPAIARRWASVPCSVVWRQHQRTGMSVAFCNLGLSDKMPSVWLCN